MFLLTCPAFAPLGRFGKVCILETPKIRFRQLNGLDQDIRYVSITKQEMGERDTVCGATMDPVERPLKVKKKKSYALNLRVNTRFEITPCPPNDGISALFVLSCVRGWREELNVMIFYFRPRRRLGR